MTPAIRSLEAAGVAFTVLEYEHDTGAPYGAEAAERLGLEPEQVFKTLVVAADADLAVAIVPVAGQLSLKATARALGAASCRAGRSSGRPASHGLRPRRHQSVRPAQAAADGDRRDQRALRRRLRQRRSSGPRGRRRAGRPDPAAGRHRRRHRYVKPRPGAHRAGWRSMASMRATRVRAGGWDAAMRARHPTGRCPPPMLITRRSACARWRP